MAEIEEEFGRFKDRIEAISDASKEADRVLCFSNTIFPLARLKG